MLQGGVHLQEGLREIFLWRAWGGQAQAPLMPQLMEGRCLDAPRMSRRTATTRRRAGQRRVCLAGFCSLEDARLPRMGIDLLDPVLGMDLDPDSERDFRVRVSRWYYASWMELRCVIGYRSEIRIFIGSRS